MIHSVSGALEETFLLERKTKPDREQKEGQEKNIGICTTQ
jgi:hypothetical protein